MKKRIVCMTSIVILVLAQTLTGCGRVNSLYGSKNDANSENSVTPISEEESTEEVTSEKTSEKEVAQDNFGDADKPFAIDISGVENTDDMEKRIDAHMTKCIDSLKEREEELKENIDTYSKYCDETDKITEFYATVTEETYLMGIMLREYSAAYAKLVMESDMSMSEKTDAIAGMYDSVCDKECSRINDEIGENLMGDMYEYYYEGIWGEALTSAEAMDAYEKEYTLWSDSVEDILNSFFDTVSDTVSFYTDISTAFLLDDTAETQKIYEEFCKKTEEMKSESESSSPEASEQNEQDEKEADGDDSKKQTDESKDEVKEEPKEEKESENLSGIRPEFKKAMDDYEAFYDEYCEFMTSYSQNASNLTLFKEYMDLLEKLEEVEESFEAWGEGDLSDEEFDYYIDVNLRIQEKIMKCCS